MSRIAVALTEEQIETRIERTIDGLDRRLMAGRLSQADYDREMAAINAWGEEQYRILAVSLNFWERFDGASAAAMASPIGRHMAAHGFVIQHTGGNCMAWEKAKGDVSVWIADGSLGLGTDHGDAFASATDFGATLNLPEGDYENGPQETTIDACIAWADSALARH